MFSYVAKSLLSKTLQTFLGKYLENIDIESIDYGSTTTTTAGTTSNNGGSGWGVCLSNVKLREGMELMKLPGKRKRTKKRAVGVTRKKKKNKNKKSRRRNEKGKTNSGVSTNDSTPVTKNSKKRVNLERGEEDSFVLPPPPPTVSDGGADVSVYSSEASDVNKGTGEILIDSEDTTLPLHEQIQNRDRLSSLDSEYGYYSSSGPSTPNQTRNGICGVPSAFCLNSNSDSVTAESEQNTADDVLSNSHMSVEDGVSILGHTKQMEEAGTSPPNIEGSAGNISNMSSYSTGECDEHPSSVGESSHDDTDISDDDSFIEIEEEFDVEDDMELVVGAGGVIGTLNIRLVGKELHVTVEDAHLIVEAVPSESVYQVNAEKSNDDKMAKTSPKKPSLGDRTTSSSTVDDSTHLMDDQDEPTIGEKIKKKSMLARYLSMVPHLFLRDCRVSLILPEKTEDDEPNKDSCDDCTVFELGIDFLSVTSGDDFLDVLRFDTGNQSSEGAPAPKPQSHGIRRSSSEGTRLGKIENQSTQNNIFSRKRMRTGKGPDGGVWLKIYPPKEMMTKPHHVRHPNEPKWARWQFLDSAESFFFRFSGLDLHAKLLESSEVKENETSDTDHLWGKDYEDFTMDSMLFGVDYVDPISLTRHQIKNMTQENTSSDESSDGTDTNGIQSIPFGSNFHRIAQRTLSNNCTNSQMALNDCFDFWNECVNQKPTNAASMDNLMPLPGFVFSLSMTDTLEINVDRNSLVALGYIKSLFTKKKTPVDEEQEHVERETNTDIAKPDLEKGDEAASNVASTWVFDEKSFPTFMQPDAVYLSSLDVSTIVIRVDAMQPRTDADLKFRYWQFLGQSIHFEQSQIDCDEQFLQNITFHVGSMECKDFVGVCEKNLLMAGMDLDPMLYNRSDVNLPCTASRVLGLLSPTAIDERLNKSYAVHVRLIRSIVPMETIGDEPASSTNVGYVNLRTGIVDINIGATLLGDITSAFTNASSIILGGPKKAKLANKSKPKPKKKLKWLYQVSTTGGTLSYEPRIKMEIPESKFRVRKGSEGVSFETFLQKLGIEYGSYTFQQPTPPSILPLCSLPENLRMHVLLYLDDLAPLERVFNIKKKKSSPFLRSHAVTKKMAKLRASSAKEKVNCQTETRRRNNVLSRLRSLDTDYLEALLALHDVSRNK